MIYELRIYHIYPGRMDAIHKRFSEHTLNFFKKYGIKVVDFWEDAEGNNRLYYVLEFKDMEEKRTKFTEGFAVDPDWLEVKRLSVQDGEIVEKIESHFMTRVPYWPMK